jgi:two-component system cell cycle sensor histidine kinase/response regulator CckA
MVEGLLRQVLEALPIPLSWAEADGRILFWNRLACELFGHGQAEVPTQSAWYEQAYPDPEYRREVVTAWDKAVAAARAEGREFHFDAVRVRTRAGRDLDVEFTGTFVAGKLVVLFHDVTDRRRAERSLRESEARLAAAFAAIPDACAISNAETGHYLLVNEGFERITGWSQQEAVGKSSLDLNVWVDYEDRNHVVATLQGRGILDNYEARFRTRTGRLIDGVVFGRVIEAGGTPLILTLTRDVTEQRALEHKLQEAERLDSIGRLAGGVAHDFNNLLTVIQGNLELALAQLPADSAVAADLGQAMDASERSARITQQLLAFGRRQLLAGRSVELNAALTEMEGLLRRVVGEGIELTMQLAPDPIYVVLDRVQLNLVLNARDAMPRGGQLTIGTRFVDMPSQPDAAATSRVLLTVADTGEGMTEAVRARIFEPFFSTKERGKGTGLGLASVYGIVQQSGGRIDVVSTPGGGSVFTLDFPRASRRPSYPSAQAVAAAQPVLGPKTVLVAEDEESLGHMIRRVLEGNGLTVLLAFSADAAERLADAHSGSIDLLLTDVVMPKQSGRDLATRLMQRFPALRVLYMSGFAGDVLEQHDLAGLRQFLQKPFRAEQLVTRVFDLLSE